MVQNVFKKDRFPADFAQMYSLGYAELCVLIESFLEGNLTVLELAEHYRFQLNEHSSRTEHLCKEITQKVWEDINSRGQE